MGLIYIFCFLNTTNRRSAGKLKKYYSVTGAEDTIFVLLWHMKMSEAQTLNWLFGWVVIIYYTFFIIGITSMIFYYKKFHPTTKVDESVKNVQCFDSNLDLIDRKKWRRHQEQINSCEHSPPSEPNASRA